jgi:hypothetical protein
MTTHITRKQFTFCSTCNLLLRAHPVTSSSAGADLSLVRLISQIANPQTWRLI